MMLFASLALEREPLQWAQLPQAVLMWAQNAGGVAAFGLALWLLTRLLQREPILIFQPGTPADRRALLTNLFVGAALIGIAGYLFVLFLWIARTLGFSGIAQWFPRGQMNQPLTVGDYALTISGTCALALVLAPILWSACKSMRCARIWALARLSIKEAVRGRIVWVFGAMSLVFLFADWFVSYKPEDQVRNYVRVVYWSMTPLFLLTACLLGAFSIPTDVKNNSIHTIVTKPVERFEIVLGRFLGYGILLSVGLFVVTCLSLVYVVRGVNDAAKNESYKARVVTYGQIHFAGTKSGQRAESVGREWSYRSYITGPTTRKPNAVRQYAIWDFTEVPAELGERAENDPVLFEFSFDIFRLSKGDEGKGVYCTFTFVDGTFDDLTLDSKLKEMQQEFNRLEGLASKKFEQGRLSADKDIQQQADQGLAQERDKIKKDLLVKYRIHQVVKEVTDYHTQEIEISPSVFKAVLTEPGARNILEDKPLPRLRVFVNLNTAREAQMLGVAQQDFYLVADEKAFWQNFLKGIIGMWCTHMLVLGVAIACSTYLSSVISLLCTLFLYVAGMCSDYLKEVAERQLDGGGPTESFIRITKQMPLALKMEDSPTTSVVQIVDSLFSWWIGRIMNLIPDINRHDLHQYVANGFDIGWSNVLFLDNFLPLAAYLLPWAVLAYYLMKYREIANPS